MTRWNIAPFYTLHPIVVWGLARLQVCSYENIPVLLATVDVLAAHTLVELAIVHGTWYMVVLLVLVDGAIVFLKLAGVQLS